MHRALPILLLLPLVAVAQDDPNVAAAAIAKKLSATPKLSEAALKPLLTAPDEVRLRFLARPGEVKLTDENRAFLAGTLAHKDSSDAVKVAAIAWLGKLSASKTAAKELSDLLVDKNVAIRAAAIEAIGAHRDPTIGPRLGKLLTDDSPQIRTAAVIGLARVGDRKQVPAIIAAYKKYTTGDEADVKYGEALAMLGETDLSLKIAPLGMKSKDYATRLAAVHALECNPSMKVIPVFMDNLVLELRRTISLDPKTPDWDQIYVIMCSELQKRTGKNFGLDTISWIDWFEGVRAQYGAPAPLFDRDRVDRWMADYQKMGPSKIREYRMAPSPTRKQRSTLSVLFSPFRIALSSRRRRGYRADHGIVCATGSGVGFRRNIRTTSSTKPDRQHPRQEEHRSRDQPTRS